MNFIDSIKQMFRVGHPKYIPAIGDLSAPIAAYMQKTALSPCHGVKLIAGPRGGESVNCWCDECHARYNIIMDAPFAWGQCTSVKDDEGLKAWLNN